MKLGIKRLIKLMVLFTMAFALTSVSAKIKDVDFVKFSGEETSLSDYKGQWVIVNLWASWCPPCIKEMPELVMFHEKYQDKGAVVIGVNFEDAPIKKVQSFADDLLINFPLVRFKGINVNSNRTPFGALRGLPSTYIVSPKGEIVASRTGLVNLEMLEDFIQQYEKENKI